jgi:hypothetical protein
MNLNLLAIKGDDFPEKKHDFMVYLLVNVYIHNCGNSPCYLWVNQRTFYGNFQ